MGGKSTGGTGTRWLAFPRGINVGGRVVPMARLRTLLADAGFEDVRTVLASGNVAMSHSDDDAGRVRSRIEALMGEEFGYEAIVQVYRADAVAACLAANPLGEELAEFHDYLVLIDDAEVRARLLAAGEGGTDGETVAPAQLGAFWRVPVGQTLSSPFGELIGTAAVKRNVTTRKLATVRKLLVA